jgi:hypothetical protein
MSTIDPDAPAERITLPGRRIATTQRVEWNNQDLLLKVGWSREGIVKEIFIDGLKPDSDTHVFMSAFAMLASHALQNGRSAAELAQWLGGPVGALLAHAAELETTQGTAIREAYECADGIDPWRAHLRVVPA